MKTIEFMTMWDVMHPEESEDEAPDQLDLDTKATTGSAPEQTMCQTCEDAGCSDCEEWLPPEER